MRGAIYGDQELSVKGEDKGGSIWNGINFIEAVDG